jgi:hypothetical protein
MSLFFIGYWIGRVTVLYLVASCRCNAAPSLSVGRVQLSAASTLDLSLFAGGYVADGHDSSVVDIFNSTSGTWSTSKLSTGRGVMCAAATDEFGGIVFFAGGKHSKANRTDVVDIYNASAATWSTTRFEGDGRDGSQVKDMVAATVLRGMVYFAGGEAGATKFDTDVVEVWDVLLGRWAKPLKLSQPRKKLAAASVGSKAIFAGGYLTGVGNVDTIDILDVTTMAWTTAKLSVPRFRLQAAAVGGMALFISGQGCSWTCATADVYDSSSNTWAVSNMSAGGRYEFAAVTLDDRYVVAAGGKMPRPVGLDPKQVDVFDAQSRSWSNTTASSGPLTTARFYAAGTRAKPQGAAKQLVLLAGGYAIGDPNATGPLSSVEVISL